MSGILSLAKDTAIYGLSSIVGRFLNWCLAPIYTRLFLEAEYGEVTLIYSYVALALIILTYGMETGFFRFANHERWKNPMEVYSTALISLMLTSGGFIILALTFIDPIAGWLMCPANPSFAAMMIVCVAIDAFLAIPYSYLRYSKRPFRFAALRLINIGLNIGFNLFFLLLCPWLMKVAPSTVSWFYDPSFGIGYIFLSNLLASVINLVMMMPELRGFKYIFNRRLLREMLVYSAPLLALGIAGILNQTLSNILYPVLVSDPEAAQTALGIYGANYKIAMVMVMFIQAFRFAYEPFIFAQSREKGESQMQAYRDAMKYFVIFALLIFLGVMFYLDILKYFIGPAYWEGLRIVPIIMMAELFFGIFFNLSLWYKLTDKTIWGMWFSLLGLSVTVGLNAWLIPVMGYMGCAIAAISCYAVMMLASYFVGRAKHPIGYPIGRMGAYFVFAAVIYAVGKYIAVTPSAATNYMIRFVLLCLFLAVVVRKEHLPVKALVTKIKGR